MHNEEEFRSPDNMQMSSRVSVDYLSLFPTFTVDGVGTNRLSFQDRRECVNPKTRKARNRVSL